jgi:hypothetical protein
MRPIHVPALYRRYFRDIRRERQFIASLSFFVTFGLIRLVTHSIRDGVGPFHDVWIGDTHVHHLVWGILLLLAVGYSWLLQLGTGSNPHSRRASRVMSALFGVGAAFTLDEFALWLHLEDVYWEHEGRASVDAVLMFGALVSAGLWAWPFLRALGHRIARRSRRH